MTMLTREAILELFDKLNAELCEQGVVGEVGIRGGAVMCLVFNAREATKDVDAVFRPTREIREASRRVAEVMGVPDDWLNDAAKGYFLSQPPAQDVLDLSNLRVWAPHADYMLAMKCVSARFDSHDADDTRFLLNHLRIERVEEACRIVEKYMPRETIPAKARFLIEEILNEEAPGR